MAAGKVKAIVGFVRGLQDLRADVKNDAGMLLERIDLATLADPDALAEFLLEMTEALTKKHLVSGGKVRPAAANLIKDYVNGMAKRSA